MRLKDLMRFGIGLLGSLALMAIGIKGIRSDPAMASVAVVFIIGGLYLLFRISYRLIKKLGLINR